MATNLPHPRALGVLALAGLLQAGPVPCPREAGELVTAGWLAYRADSIQVALRRFARADSLCPENLDAKVGLGYSLLRAGQVAVADSLFLLVARKAPANGDAWDGLTLTRWRRGDTAGAREAARRALDLHPDNAAARRLLEQLDPTFGRALQAPPSRSGPPRLGARVNGDFFEIPAPAGGWRPFYVKGVNLGLALPGKFPSEFPEDSAVYARWLAQIAGTHANTVRTYTILPPEFYRALRGWNLQHPDQALWLLHGAWVELPPDDDFDDRAYTDDFRRELRRVVDLLHGGARFAARPGHAGGTYDADVSPWVLGYIIGREWEPFSVVAYEQRFRRTLDDQAGTYLTTTGALHIETWMAAQCDYLLTYEADRWGWLRPIAYTNWPPLDPLRHVSETSRAEEDKFRSRAAAPTSLAGREYENDVVGVDALHTRPTAANGAGWFASYHVYPYYPDFMLYEPEYNQASSSEGPSNYFGYLRRLKRHHAGMPLLIAEYGVPSSRGIAHVHPQGWNHGGLDELAMARVDARMTREIRESGAAGGIVFAWIDEWFKKTWQVVDYELPAEHDNRWLNVMDPEEHYGLLALEAGDSATVPELGGDPARWRALTEVATAPAARGAPTSLRLGADEAYLYVAAEFPSLRGHPFPWGTRDLLLALDTYRPELGRRVLLDGKLLSGVGFEFLGVLRDTAEAQLLGLAEYSPYEGGYIIKNGDDGARFARRPITIDTTADGPFDSLFVLANRTRFTREGTMIPAVGVNRGRLRYGSAASSLSDWYWDRRQGLLQLRLPWALLNVSDPSTRTVLFERQSGPAIGTATTDGFRVGLAVVSAGRRPGVLATLPVRDGNGLWAREGFRTWAWPTWDTPRWHARLKPVYDSLSATWGSWR